MGNFKKTIVKQIIINVFIVALSIIIFKSVSYSFDDNNMNDNKDLLVETGNMQIVLSVPKEKYEFLNTLKLGVSDEVGKHQDGYNFTITNTGNIPIEYYEVKLVNEENKISTLPHKYLKFIINKDGGQYSDVKSLGDVNSILYEGSNLAVGKSVSFNLKMWLDNYSSDVVDKTLYSAIEVTLYQKNDLQDNYVMYESEEGDNIPLRTSIYSPISMVIPKREGYEFLGWSTRFNGQVKYYGGDTYKEEKGGTLYAVWKKMTDD